MPLSVKKKVMDSGILPCITYGSQTWTYKKQVKEEIRICQAAMERFILELRKRDQVSHTKIRERIKQIDFLLRSTKIKCKWAGHLAKLEDARWTRRVVVWKGQKGKVKRGRPSRKWVGDIINIVGDEWQTKARDRKQWIKMEEAFTLQRGSHSNN